jgi:RES domain-containing protein
VAVDQSALPIATVGSIAAFRYCSYDVPFWARPNRRPGRWHVIGDPPTQYWSLTPEAAWAELLRAEGLRSEDDVELVRMPLWVCRVANTGFADLYDRDLQEQHGLGMVAMLDDDWAACQNAGPVLRATFRGALSPCAALEGHTNLTMFGARRAIDWRIEGAFASAIPATVAAVGRPPEGLAARVTHRADPTNKRPLF